MAFIRESLRYPEAQESAGAFVGGLGTTTLVTLVAGPNLLIRSWFVPTRLPFLGAFTGFTQYCVVTQNRKPAASLTCTAFLDPENPPPDFHPQGSRSVRGRRKTNSQSDLGSYWWTASSKNKYAPLTDVTSATLALLVGLIPVLPPKDNRPFQREAHVVSGASRDQCHLRIILVEVPPFGLLSRTRARGPISRRTLTARA